MSPSPSAPSVTSNSLAHPQGQRAYIPALDGLRGLAIFGVLLFHTDNLAGGFLGVDLFFALSGYLITDLLLRELNRSGGISLLGFWERRIRRLFPALALMILAVTAAVWIMGDSDLMKTTRSDGPWVVFNLMNWHLLAESAGYWDRFGVGRVFEHLWSIAVEEQFYVVWPLLVLLVAFIGYRTHRIIAFLAAGIAIVSLVCMIVLVDPGDPTRVYMGTDTRAFSLLLGAVVATGPVRLILGRVTRVWVGVIGAVLLVVLGAAWFTVEGTGTNGLFTGGLFAHSIGAAVLVGLIAQGSDDLISRFLSFPPLRWLGLISYSLYLWHWPVIVLLPPEKTGLESWVHSALVIGISIVCAYASLRLIENPIRFHAPWACGRTGAIVFAGLLILLVAVWFMLPSGPVTMIDVDRLGSSIQ
ncbi:acyltransferase [Lysinibacter sp. HNR]|uniref:acyltransferase family protein n=1 Tax=Lysinibacter sp. HNR TaxID=3031408 RepID=UPI002434C603|nr:acyltransferase [Lysinibacter sp. HNR]WGD37642.1 acyltransferase [Lysinibacter sp. HNR]